MRSSRRLGGSAAPLVFAFAFAMLTVPWTPAASDRSTGNPGRPSEWMLPTPGYPWSFPRDHRAHPGYRTEWWYVTGHLAAGADTAARYGYQFTLFRIGLLTDTPPWNSDWSTRGVVMGHVAVTDLRRGSHVFSETLVRETPLLGGFPESPDPVLAWCRAPGGTGGRWEIRMRDGGFGIRAGDASQGLFLDLELEPEKPIVLQGPGGLSVKDPDGTAASLYYSLPRLKTRGFLGVGPERTAVTGSSWMDREWSSRGLSEGQVGWDWLSLQLEDGRDVMLYRLRGEGGTRDFGKGTLIDTEGRPRYLEQPSWTMVPGRIWKSPETGSAYPVEWSVSITAAGLSFRVVPLLDAQENVGAESGGIAYWEGAVVALDENERLLGRGYLELTGYGRRARPDL